MAAQNITEVYGIVAFPYSRRRDRCGQGRAAQEVEVRRRITELEAKVASGRRTASQLTTRVRQLDRVNAELHGRLERMERELDALRELNARLTQQREQLLSALNASAAPDGGAPIDDVPEQLSRAERRRRAREELRRRPK